MSTTEGAIVDDVLEVQADDEVRFETTYHEWATPLVVADATDPVEWDVPQGENWFTRELELETNRGTRYLVEFNSHDKSRCYSLNDGAKHSHNGFLRRLECLEEADEHVCPDCEKVFDDGQKLAGHRNTPQTDCSPIENEDDYVQEETDAEGTELPDGVTEDDVDELTSGGITIGDLADELDVDRSRARWIAHDLGFYKRVREVWRDRERAQVDPRVTGLLVVVLGLVTTGLIAIGVTLP